MVNGRVRPITASADSSKYRHANYSKLRLLLLLLPKYRERERGMDMFPSLAKELQNEGFPHPPGPLLYARTEPVETTTRTLRKQTV